MEVIKIDTIQVLRPVGKLISDHSAALVSPHKVRYAIKACPGFYSLHKHPQRLFCRVAHNYEINERILRHDFAVIICGREAAENDRLVRMVFFQHLRKAQASIHMGEPMKIDAKGERLQLFHELHRVERLGYEHLHSKVYNPHRYPMPVQVIRHSEEPDGVNLKYRRRRHNIAYRAVEAGPLPEIKNTRRMKEDQFRFRHN